MSDILQDVPKNNSQGEPTGYTLEERLYELYPDATRRDGIALHLEQLTYSHQHAQQRGDQSSLQEITQQILWWLGYECARPAGALSLLVVEDSLESLQLVTTLLSAAGYRVDSAFNGQLALEKIQSSQPDAIILDINLPDISGYEVYRALQQTPLTANIPVVFLSGVDKLETHRLAIPSLALEADGSADNLIAGNRNQGTIKNPSNVGYLQKPIDPNGLVHCIGQMLQRRPPPAPYPSTLHPLSEGLQGNPLEKRRHQALNLLPLTAAQFCGAEEVSVIPGATIHFFRATLDGRYLRMSPTLATLCGYPSAEIMAARIKNLWQEVYASTDHQQQWQLCREQPNQFKQLTGQIRAQEGYLEVIDHVCLVQDEYQQSLFYQGFVSLV